MIILFLKLFKCIDYKIKVVNHYLWFLLDAKTKVIISFNLSSQRDSNNALKLLEKSRSVTEVNPKVLVTDNLASYNMPIEIIYPNTNHYRYKGFEDSLNNNFIESFNGTFKDWYKTKKGFKNFDSALSAITNFVFHYNFIRPNSSLNNATPGETAEIDYLNREKLNWLLF